jgi:hypothetical protein
MMVVLTEYYHGFRLIPYGEGLKHSEDIIPTYFGDSISRWDGDTLVVDVTGFNDKTWLADGRDHPTPQSKGRWPHSDALHVVERWRALDSDTIEYEATCRGPEDAVGPVDDAEDHGEAHSGQQDRRGHLLSGHAGHHDLFAHPIGEEIAMKTFLGGLFLVLFAPTALFAQAIDYRRRSRLFRCNSARRHR